MSCFNRKTFAIRHLALVAWVVCMASLLGMLVGCAQNDGPKAGEGMHVGSASNADESTIVDGSDAVSGTEDEDMLDMMDSCTMTIGDETFEVSLADNATAEAFSELLPATWDMTELNGNEKYHRLSSPLPSSPESFDHVEAGDVMLFQDDCIVVFYESHTTDYEYTRIGKVNDPTGLSEAVGSGSVTISFE